MQAEGVWRTRKEKDMIPLQQHREESIELQQIQRKAFSLVYILVIPHHFFGTPYCTLFHYPLFYELRSACMRVRTAPSQSPSLLFLSLDGWSGVLSELVWGRGVDIDRPPSVQELAHIMNL